MDVNGLAVSDLLGTSQPATKLIECVSGAIGKIYEPTHIKRMAKAKRFELEQLGEQIENRMYLPTKYEGGELTIDTTEQSDLLIRAQQRLLYQETQKQQNIESVVAHAYDELEHEVQASEEPVDEDWILRFFNSVEDISNEDMQKLWGKVLAGEVKQPGTFSLRTLNALKNLTKEEAKLFEKISNFAIEIEGHCIIMTSKKMQESYYHYSEILRLEECGFINAAALTLTISCKKDEKKLLADNNNFVVLSSSAQDDYKLILQVHSYTILGKQLKKVTNSKISDDYLLLFGKELQDKHKEVDIFIHKIRSIVNDQINYKPSVNYLKTVQEEIGDNKKF